MEFSRPDTLYFESVTSTNDILRTLAAQNAPEGTAVIAGAQTAGRGRRGRTFQSPAGSGLYLSVLYRPAAPETLLPMAALGAVAAAQAIAETAGTAPQIKWPNDLIMGGKKVGGILTESALNADGTAAYVIMGIGINVHQTVSDFIGEVADMAASLDMLGYGVHRQTLANELLCKLYPLPDAERSLSFYRTHCLTLGQSVRIMSTEKTAVAVAVDEQYGLVVRYPDGTEETLRYGEVSVRGLYGYTR